MARFPELRVPVASSYGQRFARAEIIEQRRGRRVVRILKWWTTNGTRRVFLGVTMLSSTRAA